MKVRRTFAHQISWQFCLGIIASTLLAGSHFAWAANESDPDGAASTNSSRLDLPPGAPGISHTWAPALKQALGTSYEAEGASSPVWFTVAEGILTEVFYPSIDQAQIGDLQFLVTDGDGFFSEQKRDVISNVSYSPDGASVKISGRDVSGRYFLDQEIVTDPSSPVVRIRTTFHWLRPGMRLFVLFKPTINNSGAGNVARADATGLYATKRTFIGHMAGRPAEPVHSVLLSSTPWLSTSAGYVGFSDGWQDLSKNFHLTKSWPEAGPGNVALTGELAIPTGTEVTVDLALAFGPSYQEAFNFATNSLHAPFNLVRDLYNSGWKTYLDGLSTSTYKAKFISDSGFARRSAQVIKMHEDKRHRGAIVASLSKPEVNTGHAPDGIGGYHLIWPRDLYYGAMGLLAAGDAKTPVDVLKYYRTTQKADGSWHQNFWVDGSFYWTNLQMDEVAFPILLAWQLKKKGVYSLADIDYDMIRKAAEFIASQGPSTPQDRWEELGGYVPSTLAIEIPALEAAAKLLSNPRYSSIAAQWRSQLENWTLVPEGPLGRNYYLRASPSGNPSGPEPITIANGGGSAFANEIVDGGFLQLVLMGLRRPDDANILNTMRLYESDSLGVMLGSPAVPGATIYRRYNRDRYGHANIGGFWPLLGAERGLYAITAGDMNRARAQLTLLESSALPSGNIPEQIVTTSPQNIAGKGVACPLVWAHATDILLHRAIEEGALFDSP